MTNKAGKIGLFVLGIFFALGFLGGITKPTGGHIWIALSVDLFMAFCSFACFRAAMRT